MLAHLSSILVMHEHIGFLTARLDTRFHVYKAWEQIRHEAWQSIGAVVVAGEVPLNKSLIESLPNVKLIACLTSGYDGIDLEWASARGIRVTHAVGVNHEDVADHALGLLIAWQRNLLGGDRIVRSGHWEPGTKIVTRSLEDLCVGIVGMGAIGQAIAARCAPFRMKVSWWGPREKPDVAFRRASDLLTLARESDVLFVASRADETNRHLISADVLDALGHEGMLINVARGSLVDEAALIERLRSRRLAGAALDVFESEPADPNRWNGVPNVIMTPHTAGATETVLPKLVDQLIGNLVAHFAGEELLTQIAA